MIEIKPTVYISSKAKLGKGVLLGRNITIYGETIIGEESIIEDNVVIGHPSSKELSKLKRKGMADLTELYDKATTAKTEISINAMIRSFTTIYSGCKILENLDCGHNVIIRENTQIGKDVYFFVGAQIKSEVSIGNNCRIAGTMCDRTEVGDHSSMLGHTVHKYMMGIGGHIEPAPKIGQGVIVGREAILVGHIKVEDFCIIAANSILLKSTQKLALYAGIPARLVRHLKLNEVKNW